MRLHDKGSELLLSIELICLLVSIWLEILETKDKLSSTSLKNILRILISLLLIHFSSFTQTEYASFCQKMMTTLRSLAILCSGGVSCGMTCRYHWKKISQYAPVPLPFCENCCPKLRSTCLSCTWLEDVWRALFFNVDCVYQSAIRWLIHVAFSSIPLSSFVPVLWGRRHFIMVSAPPKMIVTAQRFFAP